METIIKTPRGELTLEDGLLIKYEGEDEELVLPEGVAEIGIAAFKSGTSLISVIIPGSVTKIGRNAFKNCTNLRSAIIPGSVTEIGWRAFGNCPTAELCYDGTPEQWESISGGQDGGLFQSTNSAKCGLFNVTIHFNDGSEFKTIPLNHDQEYVLANIEQFYSYADASFGELAQQLLNKGSYGGGVFSVVIRYDNDPYFSYGCCTMAVVDDEFWKSSPDYRNCFFRSPDDALFALGVLMRASLRKHPDARTEYEALYRRLAAAIKRDDIGTKDI